MHNLIIHRTLEWFGIGRFQAPGWAKPTALELIGLFLGLATPTVGQSGLHVLERGTLRGRIRGAWAGQMIGVAYGAHGVLLQGADHPRHDSARAADQRAQLGRSLCGNDLCRDHGHRGA